MTDTTHYAYGAADGRVQVTIFVLVAYVQLNPFSEVFADIALARVRWVVSPEGGVAGMVN